MVAYSKFLNNNPTLPPTGTDAGPVLNGTVPRRKLTGSNHLQTSCISTELHQISHRVDNIAYEYSILVQLVCFRSQGSGR